MRSFGWPIESPCFVTESLSAPTPPEPWYGPPANPAEPEWENIHATIGNQYIKLGAIFAANLAAADPRAPNADHTSGARIRSMFHSMPSKAGSPSSGNGSGSSYTIVVATSEPAVTRSSFTTPGMMLRTSTRPLGLAGVPAASRAACRRCSRSR